MKALQINDMHKSFGKKDVLKGLTFDVEPGEIVGFLGRNGSGKSTTMKCVSGLIKFNSGEINVFDHSIVKSREEALKCMGVSIEDPALYPSLNGHDHFNMVARWRGVSKDRIKEMEEFSGLEDNLKRATSKYSMGMKMRLMLSLVLLSKPKFIMLDEPMNGLDPDGVFELRQELKSLKNEGCAILFSSHRLSEVEKVSDRVVMIEDGKVVYNGNLSEEFRNTGLIYINTADNEKAKDVLDAAEINTKISKEKGFENYIIISDYNIAIDKILSILYQANISINDIYKDHPTLESLYKSLRKEG